KLANRAICTPDEIARDVFVPVGKFTFSTDFVVVDYESDPRVPLILGRPFLRTARALIGVHGKEMILCDEDERDVLFLSEVLPDIDSFNDIHPYFDDDPLSGSTTYSANSLLEEFVDELALISYPLDYDDNRAVDIESKIREIEFLLFQGKDSDFKDSIDQSVLTHCDDLFVDLTPKMFAEEQPPDYSFPLRFDVYPDDFLEIEFDATFDDDSFDSEGEKIKEAELLIDQLDLLCGILSHEKSVKIITHVTQEKKLAVSFASLLSEDFDPPFYELLVFKEVPNFMRLLLFSSENEEKVLKPGIYNFKKFHCCFLLELSHPGFHVFKVNLIFLNLMKIFHVQNGKNTPPLDVLLFHFYPH
nr:reverse transcriptase domain-containing protein [Tanacetum cinerariifolium]